MGKNKGQTKSYNNIPGAREFLHSPVTTCCSKGSSQDVLWHVHFPVSLALNLMYWWVWFFCLGWKFCGKVFPGLAKQMMTLFSLLWPCEPSQSLGRGRYPEIPVLETQIPAAVGWLFEIMKGGRSEFCLRLGALETKLIWMGVVGVQHLWKWSFQHFAAGKEVALGWDLCAVLSQMRPIELQK